MSHLVVSRRKQQRIHAIIGDVEIVFAIEKITGSTVRVGIVAPSSVKILRGELLDKPREQPVEVVA